MFKFIHALGATALVFSAVLVEINPAYADRGQVNRLNSQGFAICKNLKYSGGSVWEGKVRGTLQDAVQGTGARFSVKMCFTTRGECTRFVAGLEDHVTQVDGITSRRCTPK